MKTQGLMLLASTFFISAVFAQDPITSTFDNDDEGWTANGGNIYFQEMNGNPGGFIEFEDNQDGAGVFIAPDKFLGDLLSYHLGSIEFDIKNTLDNGQGLIYNFGKVSISSPYITASKTVVPFEYIEDWTSFTMSLNAEDWGLSTSAWDSLLADVTEISIQMDAQWDYYDRTGLDNFTILPYESEVAEDQVVNIEHKFLNVNYPNPFSECTTISWNLGHSANVGLKIYNLNGRAVDALVEEFQGPGYHEAVFHSGNLPDGIYLYQIQVNDAFETSYMILRKK